VFKKASYVGLLGIIVVVVCVLTLCNSLPIGPIVVGITAVPVLGLVFAKRPLTRAIPDFVFGSIDTGLLTIPALWGGIEFGVAGAIAGGVVGDAVTDSVAGFFEGSIAEWLRKKGVVESREPLTTSLGKMAGCLFGSGIVLTIALAIGIKP